MSYDDWVVAVPSYARDVTLATKTLPLLLHRGIPYDRITVWVADAEERKTYRSTLAGAGFSGIAVEVSAPGMAGTRNAIAAAHPVGTRLVQIDDDMSDIIGWRTPKAAPPIPDLGALFTLGFDVAAEQAVNLWGLYPVPNPYFMRDRVRTDLTYIGGGLFGFTVTHRPHELVSLDDKEDFERSIRYYLHDGGLARLERYSWVTKCYREPGGMQVTRTEERITASALALAERYPDLCKINTRRKNHTEIRLRDSRIAKAVR